MVFLIIASRHWKSEDHSALEALHSAWEIFYEVWFSSRNVANWPFLGSNLSIFEIESLLING